MLPDIYHVTALNPAQQQPQNPSQVQVRAQTRDFSVLQTSVERKVFDLVTMRRVQGITTLRRAIAGGNYAATSTIATGQLARASTMNGFPASNCQKVRNVFRVSRPSVARDVFTGTMFFSVASSSLEQEAHAKELPPAGNFLPKDVVLYQYEACPFCNKVKAFLDYYNIPYKVVEVNPINKKEIKWSEYKKVPILTVDGEQMVDSSEIIDSLLRKTNPDYAIAHSDEEAKWRGWVDNHLVHVLSPNIYRTASEALESFDYITTHGNFSYTERLVSKYAGAAAMYFVSKKLKKKHNITDERAALYDAAETWVDALKGCKFLGGTNPNLADLAVFGVLRPIRYLKSGKDMVEHTRIGEWYSLMESAVGKSSRVNA